MNNKVLFVIILTLVITSRGLIWKLRPLDFSEITYSYMPYAIMWASGVRPYLDQLYEYPPATIPLFYFPHLVDMSTLNKPYHITYLPAYRAEILFFDLGIILMLGTALIKVRVGKSVLLISLIYYLLVTLKAHDFIYDTMDLVFAAFMTLSVTAPLLFRRGNSFFAWFGYFIATALKYINAPMGLVYFALQRHKWKKEIILVLAAGLLVWIIPLSVYRSSLRVSLYYHRVRGLQVESMPARIADTIGRFTGTEKYVERYKNYEVSGPISDKVKAWFDIIFPVGLIGLIAWLTKIAWNTRSVDHFGFGVYATLAYLLLFMLTGKVLSTPFFLWHVPLIALLPTKTWARKLTYLIPSAILIAINMTFIPNPEVGIFVLHIFRAWINGFLMLGLFVLTLYDIQRKNYLSVRPSGFKG